MKEFAHVYLTWLIFANGDDIDEKRAQLEESVLVYDDFQIARRDAFIDDFYENAE